MFRKPILFSAICLFLLTSCDTERIFEENHTFKRKFWHADSVESFTFFIDDTSMYYKLFLNLRNTSAYPYHNIYLNYALSDSAGTRLSSKMIGFNLFHPVSGYPLGKSGIGDIFDHQFLVEENLAFPEKGPYKVQINQNMRLDTLSELLSVGVRVEPVQ